MPEDSGPSEIAERILRAAGRCIVRWSVSKATVSDIAEEAGVSRATLYRAFPGGRDELIAALVHDELHRFFGSLAEAIEDSEDLDALLARGLMAARRMVGGHALYQRVMSTEPQLILPMLSIESKEIRALIGEYLRPWVVARGVPAGPDLDELCDYLSRMVLSFIETPGGWDMEDRDAVDHLVRSRFLGAVDDAVRRAAQRGDAASSAILPHHARGGDSAH